MSPPWKRRRPARRRRPRCRRISAALRRLVGTSDVTREAAVYGLLFSPLLPPRREGFREGALAGRPLLDGNNGPLSVAIDHRYVEPGPLLEELDVALHVGRDR